MIEKYNLPPTEVVLANFRRANQSYVVGDVVSVLHHAELVLECTKAGTTSANALDTTNVTSGDTITDGTVRWTVKPNAIINATIDGKVITLTFSDGTSKTLTTQDTTYSNATTSKAGLLTATDKEKLDSLRSGGAVSCGTCSTAKDTIAKVATITQGSFTLEQGRMVLINFTNDVVGGGYQSSDSNITLNVNSSGAKKIRCQALNKMMTKQYLTNWCSLDKGAHLFCFDGVDWMLLNNDYIVYTDWSNAGT